MMAAASHVPVLLDEVLAALAPAAGEVFVDGTFGAGGYAAGLLEAADCTVWGIDRDARAIAIGRSLAPRFAGRLRLLQGRFGEMDRLLAQEGVTAGDGIALDLGVSSMQIDEPERGFSFAEDGPLDMRMGPDGPSAADVVNEADEADLADIIWRFGEERRSRRVARAIVQARERAPLRRTAELAALVARAVGGAGRIHPATRTFQALRIYVNDELGELARGLDAAARLLDTGGRLAVVSFHSLEDRMVKRFLDGPRAGVASRHLPEAIAAPAPFRPLRRGGETPGEAEQARNPRSRSARLRAGVRTAAAWDGMGGAP